ncbi:MAG: toprim domain-containing protein [Hyphomicrobiales bacterium]|nr:toprim domain-containing protein [Hyphomicrobiales bacterium]
MGSHAKDAAQALAACAEQVCRHYLSNGRRSGRYWIVGDVFNAPGRSLFVRLRGREAGPGARGKWMDAATGEHGDLLDLIRAAHGFASLKEAIDEARRFLSLAPSAVPAPSAGAKRSGVSTADAARRLWARSRALHGTHGEAYLRARGLDIDLAAAAVRFHPRLIYRADDATRTFPGLVAAVTDNLGRVTGVQRVFLDPDYPRKASIDDPRRALGRLHGNAVRFGRATSVLAVGEGSETMLSIAMALNGMPVAAALSAAHLAAFDPPADLDRLYIVRDNDAAGRWAAARLDERARHIGVGSIIHLTPMFKDFNDDLRAVGRERLRQALIAQLALSDIESAQNRAG